MRVLYKFYSDTCQPCKTLSAQLDNLGVEYTSVNIDEYPGYISQYSLRGVPTMILLDGGKEVDRRVGIPKDLRAFANEFIK